MRSKVIPALNLSKYYTGVVETLISQHLCVTQFRGAVHCEASMMGIAYAFSHGKYAKDDVALETSNEDTFNDAFEVITGPLRFSYTSDALTGPQQRDWSN